jgi:Holliday junction resolvase RusA-like endonuclease
VYIVEIHGPPIPQQQTRFSKSGHIYNPCSKQQEMIQWQVRPYAPKEPLNGPIQLDLTFYFVPPASTSAVKRKQMLNQVIHHTKKPDGDNCAYLITNALKKIFYNDDSQVIDFGIHKRYGEIAKTVVKIIPIQEISPTREEIHPPKGWDS